MVSFGGEEFGMRRLARIGAGSVAAAALGLVGAGHGVGAAPVDFPGRTGWTLGPGGPPRFGGAGGAWGEHPGLRSSPIVADSS